MLTRTFQHLQGIGPVRERALWTAGIRTWSDLLAQPIAGPGLGSFSGVELDWMRGEIGRDHAAWLAGNGAWFAGRFKRSLHWRLISAFRPVLGYLDLEADCPDPKRGRITVATVASAGLGIQVFRRDANLDALPRILTSLAGLITFGGQAFDLPLLRRSFPDLVLPPIQIDLRWVCRQVGLTQGLKAIERRIGIQRPAELDGLDGRDAIDLWRRFIERGETTALKRLVRYNVLDAIGLRQLTDHCLGVLVDQHLPDEAGGPDLRSAVFPGEQAWWAGFVEQNQSPTWHP